MNGMKVMNLSHSFFKYETLYWHITAVCGNPQKSNTLALNWWPLSFESNDLTTASWRKVIDIEDRYWKYTLKGAYFSTKHQPEVYFLWNLLNAHRHYFIARVSLSKVNEQM